MLKTAKAPLYMKCLDYSQGSFQKQKVSGTYFMLVFAIIQNMIFNKKRKTLKRSI